VQAKWQDIAWVHGRGFITVWAETAKNRRSRTIALRKEVIAVLPARRKEGSIFNYDKHSLRWAWELAKEKAAFKGRVRFHDLRHTFCRIYLEGGGTLPDLMQVTGHQSMVMVQVYSHFQNKYKVERMDAIQLPSDLLDKLHRADTGQGSDSTVINGNAHANEEIPKDQDDDENGMGIGAVLH